MLLLDLSRSTVLRRMGSPPRDRSVLALQMYVMALVVALVAVVDFAVSPWLVGEYAKAARNLMVVILASAIGYAALGEAFDARLVIALYLTCASAVACASLWVLGFRGVLVPAVRDAAVAVRHRGSHRVSRLAVLALFADAGLVVLIFAAAIAAGAAVAWSALGLVGPGT